MVKLQVLGNNSKIVINIRNLTAIKMFITARSNFEYLIKKGEITPKWEMGFTSKLPGG
jgi:hypothetical protein